MAYSGTQKTWTFVAGADLSAASNQYLFVKLNSSGQIVLCGDGEDAVGVLQDTPASGEASTVVIWGVTKVKGGGSITAGNVLSSGASGVANTSANGDYMLGKALTDGASGVISTMLFAPYGIDPS